MCDIERSLGGQRYFPAWGQQFSRHGEKYTSFLNDANLELFQAQLMTHKNLSPFVNTAVLPQIDTKDEDYSFIVYDELLFKTSTGIGLLKS